VSEDVFCEREFQILLGDEAKSFAVRWMKPVPDPRCDWSCTYSISWPHLPEKKRTIFGIDSVQALQLAMQAAATELYMSDPPVFWFEPDDILGLPVSSAIADLETARTKGRI
jgi:hypothetical protein